MKVLFRVGFKSIVCGGMRESHLGLLLKVLFTIGCESAIWN
nr:MAG TPA: hypothetical protein [Caudoviricetes sp.]